MKSIRFSILLGTLLLAGLATAAPAGPRPLRVLFLGSTGEQHNAGKCLPALMENFGRDAIYFDFFTSPACLTDETLARYDTVMLFGEFAEMTAAQGAALTKFVESGRGFVPVHTASGCFAGDGGFGKLVGGRQASHGGKVDAAVVKADHPAMAGVKDFSGLDEAVINTPSNDAALTALMAAGGQPWAWARTQGKGRVFYTAGGHDERTWKNPEFQQILRNAIVWSAGDAAKAEWEAFLAAREPEVREKSAHIANYERRPEPVTFQHPFSVKGSMERTQVPADMRLELFASEPDIRKPISFTFDERGRCWVAETSDYPHGVKPDGVGSDSIRICEDTDGDGKADKFTVFAEGLNIPTGLVFANGGIVVSQPPRFLFLKDTDGDDKADVRQEIMTGWGIGDTHAQASSLHYGFDNWLYGCVGYSGYDGDAGGKPQKFGQGTYRFKADGSQLEFLHQFSNNSWAHSQNNWGDQFGGTANGAPIFYGGIPRTVYPEGMRGMTAKRINLVGEAHAITNNYRQVDVMGGYTAAAGSNFIDSANLPPRLQGMALVNEPTMKLIGLMDVKPSGAGYVAGDGFNLVASSDEWNSPVHSEVGPDGAIWYADFQNFIIQHNPTPSLNRGGYAATTGKGGAHENAHRDHDRGRIYRVVWDQAKKPAITSLKGATTAQLIAALGSDNQFWRLKAQQLLVDAGNKDAAAELRKVVVAGASELAAVHALWALHGLGELDPATHQAALTAKGGGLRRNAVRALGTDPAAQAMLFGSNTINDPDPVTRLAALVKMAELPTNSQIGALVDGLAKDPQIAKDEWLAEALRVLSRRHQAFTEGENLLANGGFENLDANGLPTGWASQDIGDGPGNPTALWTTTTTGARTGARSLHISADKQSDKALVARVALKPNTNYRLSGWIKTAGLVGRGRALLLERERKVETAAVGATSDWREVDTVFNSGANPQTDISISFNARAGEAWFDDLKLTEMIPVTAAQEELAAGDAKRGEEIFWKNPSAGCVNCHMLGGKGSAVGPPLDKIASKRDAAYLQQALLDPSAVLADGYNQTPVSPMPPMGLILKPQELADVLAFLKAQK
jgi:putative membrane-bound dehydrogenase-like protein